MPFRRCAFAQVLVDVGCNSVRVVRLVAVVFYPAVVVRNHNGVVADRAIRMMVRVNADVWAVVRLYVMGSPLALFVLRSGPLALSIGALRAFHHRTVSWIHVTTGHISPPFQTACNSLVAGLDFSLLRTEGCEP